MHYHAPIFISLFFYQEYEPMQEMSDLDITTDDLTEIEQIMSGQALDPSEAMKIATELNQLVAAINDALENLHLNLVEYNEVCRITNSVPLFKSYIEMSVDAGLPLKELRKYSYFPDKINGRYKLSRHEFVADSILNKHAVDEHTVMSKHGEAWHRFIANYQSMVKHGKELIAGIRSSNNGEYAIPEKATKLRNKLKKAVRARHSGSHELV